MELTRFASFWHGAPLGFMERLCLKSFADHGHPIRLYTYDPELDVPDGVELADASTILPETALHASRSNKGMAPFSDRFRVNMMAETGETWTDCDVVCLAPSAPTEWAFARPGRVVAIGVLAFPAHSETLRLWRDFVNSDTVTIPADWGWKHHLSEALRTASLPDGSIPVPPELRADLPYEFFGPRAAHYFLHRTGEIVHALPPETYYAVHPMTLRGNYFFPRRSPIGDLSGVALLHGVGGTIFRKKFKRIGGVIGPHPASLIGKLCAKHGIETPEYTRELPLQAIAAE